jgi:uncharacterized protein
MSALRVSLSSVPDAGLRIDASATEEELRPEGAAEMKIAPVRVEGRLEPMADEEYLFRGTVSGAYEGTCDRCLNDADAPFALEVCWIFEEGAPVDPWQNADAVDADDEDESEETRVGLYEGDELDLAPLAWEEIVLAAPSKMVCDEECAGLCPSCGANLNEGPCGCPAETADETKGNPGLQKLAEMFPDLKPREEKE